jgi:hypothetical protein
LATFRERFTRKNLFAIFVACAFPVHVWAIFSLLNQVPAWILRVSLWDLAGMIGLTLLFALVESVLVTAGVVLLAALIPGKWFTERTVAFSAVFIWLVSILSIVAHLREPLVRSVWGLVIGAAFLAAIAGAAWALNRYPKFAAALTGIIEKLAVLTVFYLILDAIGLIVVIVRNV